MGSIGGSLSVTIPNALSQHLAEAIFIGIVNHIYYGDYRITIAGNQGVLDMSTATFKFGRPESDAFRNNAILLSQHLNCDVFLHTGLTDAKHPGAQAAFEKSVSCVQVLSQGYNANFAAGLINTDTVFSPIQMIYDNEMAGYLKHICKPLNWDTSSSTVDLKEAMTNDTFLGTQHTFENFSTALWKPDFFEKDINQIKDFLYDIQQSPAKKHLSDQEIEYLRSKYQFYQTTSCN